MLGVGNDLAADAAVLIFLGMCMLLFLFLIATVVGHLFAWLSDRRAEDAPGIYEDEWDQP